MDDFEKKISDVAQKGKEKAGEVARHVSDAVSSARTTVATADLNARKNDIADRLLDIAMMLKDKDINSKRDEILFKITDISEKVKSIDAASQERFSAKLDEVEAYIKEHPITSVAVALGAGLFFGSLFKKS